MWIAGAGDDIDVNNNHIQTEKWDEKNPTTATTFDKRNNINSSQQTTTMNWKKSEKQRAEWNKMKTRTKTEKREKEQSLSAWKSVQPQ